MARQHRRGTPFHRPSRTGLVLVVAVAALMVLFVPLPTSRDSVGSIGSNPTPPIPPTHLPIRPVSVDPQFAPAILKSPHPVAYGKFGHSVAVTSSEVVVGAPEETVGNGYYGIGMFAGAAYIENLTTGVTIDLASPTPVAYAAFGNSVAAAGNLVVVGDANASPYGVSYSGEVFLYNNLGQYLTNYTSPNSQADGAFGYSVAISGDYIIVGAPSESQSNSLQYCGNAYLINVQTGATRMIFSPVPQSDGLFGDSVSISGNLAAVGAPGELGGVYPYSGDAYLFSVSTGNMIESVANPNPSTSALFGHSVAVDGTSMLVGAPQAEYPSPLVVEGTAYEINLSTQIVTQLSSPAPINKGYFGGSVALDGVTALVGAGNETSGGILGSGDAYLFSEANGALISSNFNAPAWPHYAQFGSAVAETGSTVVVGAPYNNASGLLNAGLVYVFDQIPLTLTSPNAAYDGHFGSSVAMSGPLMVVGAPDEFSDHGRVYLIPISPDVPSLPETVLSSPYLSASGLFGWSVAISDGIVAVGAPGDTLGFGVDSSAGNVYLFSTNGTLLHNLSAPSPTYSAAFGYSVSMSGSLVVVGAPVRERRLRALPTSTAPRQEPWFRRLPAATQRSAESSGGRSPWTEGRPWLGHPVNSFQATSETLTSLVRTRAPSSPR